MTEQHIYEGEGSPYDQGIHAPAGSHYIDSSRDDHVWLSTFHDPVAPYTRWIKLEEVLAPGTDASSLQTFILPLDGRSTGVMRGGQVVFEGLGTIFSNVEMAVVEGDHVYSSVEPFMFSAVAGTEVGSVIFTVTPMFEYAQGGTQP